MSEENKNTSIVKHDIDALARVNKSLEVTKKLLTLNDDPFLIPYRKGDKWGYCDKAKKIIIPCVYDGANPFIENLACVKIGGNWGFIDKSGKIIIPCIYNQGQNPLSKVLASVYFKGQHLYFDKSGKEIIYDDVEPFSEGLAAVKLRFYKVNTTEFKLGFIDINGKEIIPCTYYTDYSYHTFFSEGLAAVQLGWKWGFH